MIFGLQLWQIPVVVFAFGMLVFIHELGHYLAARIVGVRVERFMIGIDAWGLALKKEINGVVYGIGALPLGGYVKLAGQADDPREQKVTGAPDELPSKPLWAQGFVYVAGVTMNIIFGFLLLVGGYIYGIPFEPNIVGQVVPDTPAAMAELKTGDEILSIDGVTMMTFNDIQQYVVGHPPQKNEFYTFKIERNGKPMEVRVRGEQKDFQGRTKITQTGIQPPINRIVTSLSTDPKNAKLVENFREGDEILAIGDVELSNQYEGHLLMEAVKEHPGAKDLFVRIKRDGKIINTQTRVGAYGRYDIGCGLYAVCQAVVPNSPAHKAGLRKGDRIYAIDDAGKETLLMGPGDLIDHTKVKGFRPTEITVWRKGDGAKDASIPTGMVAAKVTIEPKFMGGDVRIPAGQDTFLGILAKAENDRFVVTEVFPEGPSAGKLQAGDILVDAGGTKLDAKRKLGSQIDAISAAELVLYVEGRDAPVQVKPSVSQQTGIPRIGIELGGGWIVSRVKPGSIAEVNGITPGSTITDFTISQDMKSTTISWSTPEKTGGNCLIDTPASVIDDPKGAGLVGDLPIALQATRKIYQYPVAGAIKQAGRETVAMSMSIFNLIEKLASRKVSIGAVGGPAMLFKVLAIYSNDHIGRLIWIVALISINLAVLNILPIPVLDGGHVLFLVIEGVYILFTRGRRPNELVLGRIKEVSQYVGLVGLLTLLATVSYYDLFT